MPFILLLVAIVLIVTGLRGTIKQLGTLLKSDLTGPNNFGVWAFAFFVVGAIGYIPAFKKLSDAFLLLIIVVILIVNDKNGQGFFTGVQAALSGQAGFTNNQGVNTQVGTFTTQNGGSVLGTLTTLPSLTTLPENTSVLGTLSALPPLIAEGAQNVGSEDSIGV